MQKHITFKEFLEIERKRKGILDSASRLDEIVDSARKINDTSLSNSALKAIEERERKYNKMLDDSSLENLNKAIQRTNINTTAFESVTKSLLNTISPISDIYSSELNKIQYRIDEFGPSDIINSDVFIEARKIQDDLVKFDPGIGILPITTLEESIKSDDPNVFEKATKEVRCIEKVEKNRVSNSDIQQLDKNPTTDKPIDVLIVTGLPLELRTFCDAFKVTSRWYSDKYVSEYYFGTVESDNRSYSVALTFGEDMGNIYASQVTNAAIDDLNPVVVISAGIGYTLNPCKLQLCDLHITNSIVYWGLVSKEYEYAGRKVRSTHIQVKSNHLLREIRNYVEMISHGKTPFAKWQVGASYQQPQVTDHEVNVVLAKIDNVIRCGIPEKYYNKHPHVEVGKTMVSDDTVIASLDEIRKRSNYDTGNENHFSGEMEAAGVAIALANRKSDIEFIAIRGVCDFGYGKEALEGASQEFRLIAATRVATFIKSFLESDPTLPKIEPIIARELGMSYGC